MTKQQIVTSVAKFPGRCEFCGRPIAKGDTIAFSFENQCWVHPECWEADQIESEDDGYDPYVQDMADAYDDWENDDE